MGTELHRTLIPVISRRQKDYINVLGASGKPLGISVAIHLLVNFGPKIIKLPFLESHSLTVAALLGTQFIDLEDSIVHVRDRYIELTAGTEVLIFHTSNRNTHSFRAAFCGPCN